MKNCLYIGLVFHKRYTPKKHVLRYNVFTLFADLDELENIAGRNRFFSLNRFNLVSFHEADYGDPSATNSNRLKDKLLRLLSENNIDATAVKNIKILAYPRVLGFAFNPLTVYYCYGDRDKNIAIIYEVRNTFSERHNYIYAVPDHATFGDPHRAHKCFHVSPFFDQKGSYDFSLTPPNEKIAVTINYNHLGKQRLTACFSGNRQEISDGVLIKLAFKMPFMTLKVISGILLEAVKLKLKGLKVYPHPEKHAYQSSKATSLTEAPSRTFQKDVK